MDDSRATVLVVDDTPENIELLDGILRARYRIKAALNGEQALKLAQQEPRPDLILLDVMMPAMDGYEVCRRLKADPGTAGIPVIFVTARGDEEDERLGLSIGAVDYLTKPVRPAIVEQRVRTHLSLYDQKRALENQVFERTRALTLTNANLEREMAERERAMARVEFLAHFDPLTSLPNRRHFMQTLEEATEEARRASQPLGLLILNLDRFHVALDTLGQAAAERLLSIISDRLYQSLRLGDKLGRTGYDEFALMIRGAGADARYADFCAQLGADMLERVHQAIRIEDRTVEITASAGLALFPSDGRNALELLRRADLSMLFAKELGRNRLERYRAELDAGTSAKFELESRLRQALATGKLRTFFQPVIDLENRRVLAAEALVRLPEPEGPFADTATVIALAQEAGLIAAIDLCALHAACVQMKRWQDQPTAPRRISVNVSAQHFQHSEYVRQVEQALLQTGLDPRRLEIEITEQALITQWSGTVEKLAALRAIGIQITLDDFGTGYSSLSYLKRLPIDRVKIDAQFTRDLGRDRGSDSIVQAILLMAGAMGYEAVAEGVETEAQRQFLLGHDCRAGQGFLFSPAVPAETLEALIVDGRLKTQA